MHLPDIKDPISLVGHGTVDLHGIQLVQYFGAYTGGDERGIGMERTSVHSTREGAALAVQGKGGYGGDGNVSSCWCIEIAYRDIGKPDGLKVLRFEVPRDPKNPADIPMGPIDVDDTWAKKQAAIESARAKLSPEERQALGI